MEKRVLCDFDLMIYDKNDDEWIKNPMINNPSNGKVNKFYKITFKILIFNWITN